MLLLKIASGTAIFSQLLAFVISIIFLMGGRNGNLENVYYVKINSSQLGKDLFAVSGSGIISLNQSVEVFPALASVPALPALPAGPQSQTGYPRISALLSNELLNKAAATFRSEAPVNDWYAFYPTQICWGAYKKSEQGAAQQLVGCGTTDDLINADLNPAIRRTLKPFGFSLRPDQRIGLLGVFSEALSGIRDFTNSLHGLHVATAVITGITAFTNLFGMTLMPKKPHLVPVQLLLLSVIPLILSFVNAVYVSVFLSGVRQTLPSLLHPFNVSVSIGDTLLGLLWFEAVLSMLSFGGWYYLWFSIFKMLFGGAQGAAAVEAAKKEWEAKANEPEKSISTYDGKD